jgi:hypothetical protein
MSLYVFSGFPKSSLHAGGLRRFIETETLGLLEEDPTVQYTRENAGEYGYYLSALCERDGIGWDWFLENWTFGNGVTVHKTTAEYRKRIVILETNTRGMVVEDRSAYEARWMPGTCPQESHDVHLTWCVFRHELPGFAYERLRAVIEDGAAPLEPDIYEDANEPGKFKSATRTLAFGKGERHALSGI